eukprot:1153642-Pelagomonas_calceolata.AAC.1
MHKHKPKFPHIHTHTHKTEFQPQGTAPIGTDPAPRVSGTPVPEMPGHGWPSALDPAAATAVNVLNKVSVSWSYLGPNQKTQNYEDCTEASWEYRF